jgi:hypothetical protein
MDPDAVWERILEAVREGRAYQFQSACNDLQEWVERGGFYPSQWKQNERGAWRVILSNITARD